jgi:tRNA U34 2-thiouridine synthase MnmA/TrmU
MYDGGEVVGQHRGLWTFTVGQNARVPGMKERLFVARKDPLRNQFLVVNSAYA